MPKMTEEHMEARRRQIQNAALRCFRKKGYHESNMQMICKEARLSAGAVYNHYKSKEDILKAVVVEGKKTTLSMLEKIKADPNPRNALLKLTVELINNPESRKEIGQELEIYAIATRKKSIHRILTENHRLILSELECVLRSDKSITSQINFKIQSQLIYGLLIGMSALGVTENINIQMEDLSSFG